MLKVLKALAEYLDMSLGDLLEGIVLHAFEGRGALEGSTLEVVRDLKKIYGMDYGSELAHMLIEAPRDRCVVITRTASRGRTADAPRQ